MLLEGKNAVIYGGGGGVPESLPEGVEGREKIIERTTGATATVSCGALVD